MLNPIRFFEWSSKSYADLCISTSQKEYISGFQAFLDDVWQSRNWYKEETEGSAKNQRFFTFSFDKIQARNYVGIVQYGGKRFEIYPKIFHNDKEHDYKNYFKHFAYWLSYCRRLNFPVSKTALDNLETEDFLEALIHFFAHYTEEVLTEQPFQAFEEIQEETPFLRGRLAMAEYISQNLATGRWQYFQSEYEPLLYDNLFNQIIKYTTRILASVSKEPENKNKLEGILFLLDEVSDCVCTAAECDKVKLNPLYAELSNVLQLCKLFHSSLSVDNNNQSDSNFCFMLPMEYVFEDFIFSFIKKHFADLNPEDQKEAYLALNNGKDVFKIKNDILIKKKSLIIDTKYKVRYDDNDGKEGVSQGDLYQMLAYAIKRGYHDVLLMYPSSSTNNVNNQFTFTICSPFLSVKPVKVSGSNIKISSSSIGYLDEYIFDQIKQIFNAQL